MPVIGTAGHVDHGKSTLVERLTGRDPDRWDEEKRRGLTIDLGFAWAQIGDTEVSFVDVPGHERYLKNMLAGIEAIDVALFVVAADEGWMPQSEEHLAVLDLLDVNRGVIALTKSDLVDSDLLELAILEVSERLEGTALEGAEIIPVSGVTGEGVEGLLAKLDPLVNHVASGDRGRPRLWVDRSFTSAGVGTVVTGTLLDGPLSADEVVSVYPRSLQGRIRSLQSHEKPLEQAGPRRRLAINLSGVDHSQVRRGDMIGLPDQWDLSDRLSASIRPARYVEKLDQRGAYQIHIGTAVQQVEILATDGEVAVLRLSRALPAAIGDRFVVRDTGRRLVVAGGRVLDPSPGPSRAALGKARAIDPDLTPDELARALIQIRHIDRLDRLSRHTLGGTPMAKTRGPWAVSMDELERLISQAADLVAQEHEAHPLRPGLPMATLAGRLGVEADIAELVVDSSPHLVRSGPDVSLEGHEIELTPTEEADWDRTKRALESSLAVPLVEELSINPELLHLKIRIGELVRVSDELVYLPGQIDSLKTILGDMPQDFTVADFRDAAGLTRKYAVPLLEWADNEGLTVRRGDTRSAV